jgi:hypothetical protein
MEFECVDEVVDSLFVELSLFDRESDRDGSFKFFHELGEECAEDRVKDSVAGEARLEFVDVFFAGMELHLAGGRTVRCEVRVNDSGHRIV